VINIMYINCEFGKKSPVFAIKLAFTGVVCPFLRNIIKNINCKNNVAFGIFTD
jgi:hypothetical protein